jgi:hypothetical protein
MRRGRQEMSLAGLNLAFGPSPGERLSANLFKKALIE